MLLPEEESEIEKFEREMEKTVGEIEKATEKLIEETEREMRKVVGSEKRGDACELAMELLSTVKSWEESGSEVLREAASKLKSTVEKLVELSCGRRKE